MYRFIKTELKRTAATGNKNAHVVAVEEETADLARHVSSIGLLITKEIDIQKGIMYVLFNSIFEN